MEYTPSVSACSTRCNKIPQTGELMKKQKFTSHRSEGREVRGQSSGVVTVWGEPSSWVRAGPSSPGLAW